MNIYKYSKRFNERTQQWDIYLDEEECSTYVCSFGPDEEADMNAFLNSANGV